MNEAEQDTNLGCNRRILRLYIYFYAIMVAAVHVVVVLNGFPKLSLLFGLIPGALFLAFLVQKTARDMSPLGALARVLLVPGQVLLHTLYFDGTLETFILEEGLVEIGGFCLAMTKFGTKLEGKSYGPKAFIFLFFFTTLVGLAYLLGEQFAHMDSSTYLFSWIAVAIFTSAFSWSSLLTTPIDSEARKKISRSEGKGRRASRDHVYFIANVLIVYIILTFVSSGIAWELTN